MDPSLRREIVEFVRGAYANDGTVETVRDLLNYFWLSRYAIYHAFPGGMREICREAGVPVPEERYRATAAASAKRKTTRSPSGRGIGSDAADLEKVAFAEQVLRLAKIFRQAQSLSIT